MGLAISRVIRRDGYDYKAADPLELRHLGMSDLEETPNVQSSAPALGDRASWHWKVQVGRTFAAAPHQPRMPLHISQYQWRDLLRALFVAIVRALFVVIAGMALRATISSTTSVAAWLHWWALVRAAFGDGYCVTRRRRTNTLPSSSAPPPMHHRARSRGAHEAAQESGEVDRRRICSSRPSPEHG